MSKTKKIFDNNTLKIDRVLLKQVFSGPYG